MSNPTAIFGAIGLFTASLTTVGAEEPVRSFKSFAEPFLVEYCFDCHDASTEKGGVSLEELADISPDNAVLWKSVWEQVALGEMPPRDKKNQPEKMDRFWLSQWITGGLEQALADEGGFYTHLHPAKANHLDHDLLFGEAEIEFKPASTPARIWRIHPQEHLVRLNELIDKEPDYDPENPGLRARGDHIPWNTLGEVRVYFGLDRITGWVGGSAAYTAAITGFPPILTTANDHGLRNYAMQYSVNGAEATQISQNAEDILVFMAHGPKGEPYQFVDDPKKVKRPAEYDGLDIRGTIQSLVYSRDPQRPLTPVYELLKEPGVTDEKIRAAVDFLFEALTFRPPTKKEAKTYVRMVQEAIADLGEEEGAILGLSSIFLDREALFRTELVEYGTPDEHDRVMLQDWELALAVNGAFSYLPPNSELRQAVLDGRMKTREDVEREVARIIEDPSIRKPRVLQFFREYFDYDRAGRICKDTAALKKAAGGNDTRRYTEAMYAATQSTDRLIELILEEDRDVLSEILTTDRVVYDRRNDTLYYSTHENLKNPKPKPHPEKRNKKIEPTPEEKGHTILPDGERISVRVPALRYYSGNSDRILTTAPKEERMGILTHPAWLVSHTDAMDNHAIHRGKWVRERLLGGAVPDVPITVDAQLPDEPGTTLRHRMRVTSEEYCWSCHDKMDPLGFPFEMYNHIGLYRTTEYGEPVDTSGEIIDSGDPSIDGPVTDALDLIRKLAESERVEQVFVRHAFRYWMGRNETLNDAPILQEAWRAYRDSGSMNALITSLVTSDAFLYRQVTPKRKGIASE
ncbi:MAG: DUF1588 domain-containing protein [Verrucomicrobiota bacterium]